MTERPSRNTWGSRAGFILAAAGSAVGLGNIWGFPTQVGQGGGAAFVVVYLACIFLICAPIMAGEIALGRRTRQSPVGSFAALAPGRAWCGNGIMSMRSRSPVLLCILTPAAVFGPTAFIPQAQDLGARRHLGVCAVETGQTSRQARLGGNRSHRRRFSG